MICEKLSRKDSWFGRLSHSWNHFFSLFEEVIATNSKRSGPEIFLRKDVVKICIKFTGEHPCRSAISINLQYNFIEITLRHGCFPVNLLHIFRTPFSKNTSGWLLLDQIQIKWGLCNTRDKYFILKRFLVICIFLKLQNIFLTNCIYLFHINFFNLKKFDVLLNL